MRKSALSQSPLKAVFHASLSASLIAATLVASYTAMAYPAVAIASAGVSVWWPSSNVELGGVQPFKAVVDGRSISDYAMYWQVDGGNLVSMYDSQNDYPHKEAMVDLGGWNWNQSGQYSVTFVAKDTSGNEIGKNTVVIRHGAPSVSPTGPAVSVIVPTPETARLAIRVWWPTSGTSLTGTQPIKAVLESTGSLPNYRMYWSVGDGGQNEMYDNSTDGAHKENLIDFSGWHWKGNNQYAIKLTAKDDKGNLLASETVPVYANKASVEQPVPQPAPDMSDVIVVTMPPDAPVPTSSASKLYIDPNNPALSQARSWTDSRPADAKIMAKIGAQPTGIWLGGWNGDVEGDVKKTMTAAADQSSMPTFIAYNIPGRDCGSYSAGGAANSSDYRAWIRGVSNGLGKGRAILVLEPDGLASIDCLSGDQQSERYSMLSQAVDTFNANNPSVKVYIDAGHSGWVDANEMARRLVRAGVARTAGFALNVSNYVPTDENVAYGETVSGAVDGSHFIVDTSRNGAGSNGEWCNPSGRALGRFPTLSTGNSLADAFLWLKKPGESDGTCNGGPSAGNWWPEYALDLAVRAGY